jgi:2-oxoglutarate dehydrogenase E2 component (dihydrolipoamide succinyltransferase)
MAKIDVIMPQMGESIAEGTLSKWLKKVGDEVKRDEPIFEISTDKVDAEIPAPTAGVLAEVLVQEGQTVAVQTVVARIETDKSAVMATAGSAPARAGGAAPAPKAAAPSVVPERKHEAAPVPAPAPPPAPPLRSAPAAPRPSEARPAASAPAVETAEERLRTKSTPLVRKIAAEHGIDLTGVSGSGHAGRVTKDDILGLIEGGGGVPAQLPRRGPAGAGVGPEPGPAAPARPAGAPAAPGGPAFLAEPWAGDRVEPWSRIRKLTAEHMSMSRRTSAHVQTFFDVDYTRVSRIRAQLKAEYANRGVNLTYLAFIAKAVADSLKQHPVLNAAVGADVTIYRRDINLGIAVALDWGLIVPVIREADGLSLLGLARAITDLAERARAKKLNPDEVQRGTFTITNPGVFGSVIGAPIINQPQVAILAVGSIGRQPAVVAVDGVEAIGIRTMGMLSLSFDHRVVDGADADRFMASVKDKLENFPEDAA